MVSKLTTSERETSLDALLNEGWAMVEGRDAIKKTYKFKNFNETWSWMTRVAMEGEKLDHHPEWFNVYNRVEVTWSTHCAGGLSMNDVKMAYFGDNAAKLYS